MQVRTLKDAIMLSRKARVTPFIWGHRGLGKSQVTAQTAAENGLGFSDWRLSQCESSDLRGLPLADEEKGLTRFLAPEDLPTGGLTWDQYIEKLQLVEVMEKSLTKTQLKKLIKADEQLLQNPDEVIKILASLGKYNEADQIAKRQAELQPKLTEGILFLDEINRAQDDVLQAVFQLVLDRRLGTYALPTGWHIVCAGNYNEGQYVTNGFTDAAFLDRFTHINLDGGEPTLEEWVNYMSSRHGDAAVSIIEFATQNPKHLDGDISGELGFTIQPSRRSWEAALKIEKAYRGSEGEFSDESRLGLIAGLIGHELTRCYLEYNCPVRPKDLVNDGVSKHKSALQKLNRGQRTGLCWGLVSYLKGKVDDDKKAKVALDFAEYLTTCKDKDIAVAFCNLMIGGNNQKARSAMVSNPSVAKLISRFKENGGKKTFVDRLNERPKLQNVLSECAWGKE